MKLPGLQALARLFCKVGIHDWTDWFTHGKLLCKFCPRCKLMKFHDLSKIPELKNHRG